MDMKKKYKTTQKHNPNPTTKTFLSTKLRLHQKAGIIVARDALAKYGGILIADEMGLGKTLTAIYCVLRAIRLASMRHTTANILVVVPSAVLLTWRDEFQKHIHASIRSMYFDVVEYQPGSYSYDRRSDRLSDYMQTTSKSLVVLASYGLVRNDSDTLLSRKWDYMVFDECHMFKNTDTELHQLLLEHVPRNTKRIGLSGTPNSNQPVNDMSALSQILFPQLTELHDPENYANGAPQRLHKVILRRTVESIGLKMPQMNIQTIKLSFVPNGVEWKAYDKQMEIMVRARDKFLNASYDEKEEKLKKYQSSINQLGKFTTHPHISQVRSGKIRPHDTMQSVKEAFTQHIMNTFIRQKKHLIVTSTSSSFLNILHAKNPKTSILFTGETSMVVREKVLKIWRSKRYPNVLLLSIKAGGVGLTLIEASTMVCVDGLSQANPAERAQVMKRIHRMGQTDDVTIYDLCVCKTIDEVMLELVYPTKQTLSTHILEGNTTKTSMNKMASIGLECIRYWNYSSSEVQDSHTP